MTTKLTSKTQKRECASEEPDEGNLQVRFCEGAHSITLGLLPQQMVGYGLYSTEKQQHSVLSVISVVDNASCTK
jgi:hypothetical protein